MLSSWVFFLLVLKKASMDEIPKRNHLLGSIVTLVFEPRLCWGYIRLQVLTPGTFLELSQGHKPPGMPTIDFLPQRLRPATPQPMASFPVQP